MNLSSKPVSRHFRARKSVLALSMELYFAPLIGALWGARQHQALARCQLTQLDQDSRCSPTAVASGCARLYFAPLIGAISGAIRYTRMIRRKAMRPCM
jgi:hypothetical protein